MSVMIRDDFTTDTIRGSARADHLIHHRDPSVTNQDSTDLSGFSGDDTLEASVPNAGQIHMFGAVGDDLMILDVTKNTNAIGVQGHHAYGGHGQDIFNFVNIGKNASPIFGRLDDFDPTVDRIMIEDKEIDLTSLPRTVRLSDGSDVHVRVISVEHPEFAGEDLGEQYFLAIGNNIFYALEGARDLSNGKSSLAGEERHFLKADSLDALRSAETVEYENPKNFVPHEFYEPREDELNLNWNPNGVDVTVNLGSKSAAHMFGAKGQHHAHGSSTGQTMRGSAGDDVIDGNSGNDTIFGGGGHDLLGGGIDDDVVHGNTGNDMIWGGDGNDILHGGKGDDYLHGGRGDDLLAGGEGDDTIFGGGGDNTLVGGGGEDAVNRFHFYEFYEDGGQNIITDFKVGLDIITLQDDIEPQSVELYENEDGNTVLNYGETGSVELQGVSLSEFQEAAALRSEEGNPVIAITPDPEEELLQEFRTEIGFYGNQEPPSLEIEGIEYGATPFQDSGPGGYSYVSASEGDDGRGGSSGPNLGGGSGGAGQPGDGLPPPRPNRPEDDEEEDDDQDSDEEDTEGPLGTCFVATAAYGDPWHPDVVFLRAFRDQWLINRVWGRAFIAFYWWIGPKMAAPVRKNPRLARSSKYLLSGVVSALQKVWR